MRYAIAIIVVLIAIGCKKESTLLEPPKSLEISSQQDIDKYADAIHKMDSLSTVIFKTAEDLDLDVFENITRINILGVKNCQQIDAFDQLISAGSIRIQNLDSTCLDFVFPSLEEVSNSLFISGNKHLESYAFPSLKSIELFNHDENISLREIRDLSALENVERMIFTGDEKLSLINGFQRLNSTSEFSDYQINLIGDVDYKDAFTNLKHIANLKFRAHREVDLDWVSNVKSSNRLEFTGMISPEQLCGAVPLIKEDDNVIVVLNSWIDFTAYGNQYLIENCD